MRSIILCVGFVALSAVALAKAPTTKANSPCRSDSDCPWPPNACMQKPGKCLPAGCDYAPIRCAKGTACVRGACARSPLEIAVKPVATRFHVSPDPTPSSSDPLGISGILFEVELKNVSKGRLRVSLYASNISVASLVFEGRTVEPRFLGPYESDPPEIVVAESQVVELGPGESRSFKKGLLDNSWGSGCGRQFAPTKVGRYSVTFGYRYVGERSVPAYAGLVVSEPVSFEVY